MRKRKTHQHRFDLYDDDPTDADLHDYLLSLAESSKASNWVRGTLKTMLTAQRMAIDVPSTLEQMRAETANVERLSKTISRQFTGTITTRNVEENPIPAAYAEDDGPDDEPQYVEPEDIA